MGPAGAMLEGVEYAPDAYACLSGADAAVLVTEWEEFRALDLERVRGAMRAPVLVDLRNVYRPDHMAKAGFTYVSVGRAFVADVANETVEPMTATAAE
jgi:UDPglucose 6-dehydrogenase